MRHAALIIGPGSAFGFELCEVLLKTREVMAIARSLQRVPHGVKKYYCDINSEDFDEVIAEILRSHHVDVVIYAAKYSPRGGLELSSSELEKAYSINVIGLLKTLHALSRAHKASHVIVLGGGYKDKPHPHKIALSSSKAALHNMILALQDECLRNNIILNELVIDGRVGVDGSIRPLDIVQQILDISSSHRPLIHFLS